MIPKTGAQRQRKHRWSGHLFRPEDKNELDFSEPSMLFYAQESATWMTRNTTIALHRIPARWFMCPLISTSLRMSSALRARARSLGSLMGYLLFKSNTVANQCCFRDITLDNVTRLQMHELVVSCPIKACLEQQRILLWSSFQIFAKVPSHHRYWFSLVWFFASYVFDLIRRIRLLWQMLCVCQYVKRMPCVLHFAPAAAELQGRLQL